MELKDIKAVYFIGAGGIGMSALARYFIHRGLVVAGYDKTPSTLTHQLEKEGMLIHYEEDIEEIPHVCKNPQSVKRALKSRNGPKFWERLHAVIKVFALQARMERPLLRRCVHT